MFSAAVYWLAVGALIHGTLRVQCEAKDGCKPRRPGLAVGMYVQTEWRDPEDARRVRAKNFARARNCGYVRHPRKQRTSRFQEMVGFMLKL